MKKILIISSLILLDFYTYSQPGDYCFFCFKLYNSCGFEIDSSSLATVFDIKYLKVNSDLSKGFFYSKEKDSLCYSCIMGTYEICNRESIIQIVKARTDTLRLYYLYNYFEFNKPMLLINSIFFKPGNYIIKEPVDIDDWLNYERGYKIIKISGGFQDYLKAIEGNR